MLDDPIYVCIGMNYQILTDISGRTTRLLFQTSNKIEYFCPREYVNFVQVSSSLGLLQLSARKATSLHYLNPADNRVVLNLHKTVLTHDSEMIEQTTVGYNDSVSSSKRIGQFPCNSIVVKLTYKL